MILVFLEGYHTKNSFALAIMSYYVIDLVLLANTPTQAESLQLRQEQAASVIGVNLNLD